jgi:hypothetical protein
MHVAGDVYSMNLAIQVERSNHFLYSSVKILELINVDQMSISEPDTMTRTLVY